MCNAKLMVIIVAVIVLATSLPVDAGSTEKTLSTNYTVVNLHDGDNSGIGQPYWSDGSRSIFSDTFTFSELGEQVIRRQYGDDDFFDGPGSVVVTATKKVGAVVQIQTRNAQIPSRGSHIGVVGSSTSVGVPLVVKQLATASGIANSQIIVQNASETICDIAVDLVDASNGETTKTQMLAAVPPYTSQVYDLSDDPGLSDGWYGSGVVRATTPGCTVAVIANLFTGEHGLQTFNTFSTVGEVWSFPLFASRLNNGLSIPITVQNQSGGDIPVGGIQLTCVKDGDSPGAQTLQVQNGAVVKNQASVFFNPVVNTNDFPDGWYGACRVESTGYATVAFAQIRTVGTDRVAAYEGIDGNSSAKTVVCPLYAKRLNNAFATAITIQNLSKTEDAHITLTYKPGSGLPTECGATLEKTIAPGGNLIQNHRLSEGPGSVPQIGDHCYGALLITSQDQPIGAVVQFTDLSGTPGDTLMAHNAFTTEEVMDTTVYVPLIGSSWLP